MAITTSVLMCHAPIVVPGVADPERAAMCEKTTRAMREAGRHVVATDPDVVVIVSPHAPRHPRSFLVASDPEVAGTFARFGAPAVGARLPFAEDAGRAIARHARELGVPCADAELGALDHGTLVPLVFVAEAGFTGAAVRLALPYEPTHAACEAMGRAIAAAAAERGERVAFVASGDMSHRLLPGAPSGFDPRAKAFDEAVTRAVASGDCAAVRDIDPALRDLAAEDVVDSLDMAIGVLSGSAAPESHRLLSYEGPFGVGYLVAVLG